MTAQEFKEFEQDILLGAELGELYKADVVERIDEILELIG